MTRRNDINYKNNSSNNNNNPDKSNSKNCSCLSKAFWLFNCFVPSDIISRDKVFESRIETVYAQLWIDWKINTFLKFVTWLIKYTSFDWKLPCQLLPSAALGKVCYFRAKFRSWQIFQILQYPNHWLFFEVKPSSRGRVGSLIFSLATFGTF